MPVCTRGDQLSGMAILLYIKSSLRNAMRLKAVQSAYAIHCNGSLVLQSGEPIIYVAAHFAPIGPWVMSGTAFSIALVSMATG